MAQHGLDLLIVDYMQLMSTSRRFENRQLEISEISRSIKGLGRELNVPVIAVSQLSREAERDDTGIPKLSHLRESGAIEQDADVVLMLAKPPAHRLEETLAKRGIPTPGDPQALHDLEKKLIQVIVAKQRNGPTGSLYLLFDRDTQHFGELVKGGDGGAMAAAPHEGYATGEAFEEDEEVPF
jgi:replicative DNA helicase